MAGLERLTPKGERTRDHILDTALDLFVQKGYHDTTMREIATTAECSLGLTYRYFARKEDLVLALYRRLGHELEGMAQQLPPDRVAARFEQVMAFRLQQIGPYRDLFGSIIGAALSPSNDLGVLGDQTEDVREQSLRVFQLVVTGATDAPVAQQAEDLAVILYAAHLCLLLFWFYDQQTDQRATHDLISLSGDLLQLARRIMRWSPASKVMVRLARAIEPVFLPKSTQE